MPATRLGGVDAGVLCSPRLHRTKSLPCARGLKHRATYHCDRLTLDQADAAEFLREARDVKRPWAQLQRRCPKDRPVPLHVVTRHHLHQRYGRWRFGGATRRKMWDGKGHGSFVSCPDRSALGMCPRFMGKYPDAFAATQPEMCSRTRFHCNCPAAKVARLDLKRVRISAPTPAH